MNEVAFTYAQRLETRLTELMTVKGANFEEKIRGCHEGCLPDGTAGLLLSIASDPVLKDSRDATLDALLDFMYRCGQAHEQLEDLGRGRLAETIAFVQSDGTSVEELETIDMDALARFAAMRDLVLKTVADYTLKFLLVSAVLLILGLSLGLI
jgi:hypothetical protein